MLTGSTAAPGRLTEAQRRELLGLIRDNPAATCRQLAALFEARTGRRIASESVRRAWVVGYRPAEPGDRHRPLTEAERMVLAGLCRILAPRHGRTEIARRFEAATGRGIKPGNVRRFMRDHLGIVEPGPTGRPRKGARA